MTCCSSGPCSPPSWDCHPALSPTQEASLAPQQSSVSAHRPGIQAHTAWNHLLSPPVFPGSSQLGSILPSPPPCWYLSCSPAERAPAGGKRTRGGIEGVLFEVGDAGSESPSRHPPNPHSWPHFFSLSQYLLLQEASPAMVEYPLPSGIITDFHCLLSALPHTYLTHTPTILPFLPSTLNVLRYFSSFLLSQEGVGR